MRHVTLGSAVFALFVLVLLSASAVVAEEEPTDAAREKVLDQVGKLAWRFVELYRAGKYREAEPVAREALTLCEAKMGPDDPLVARCRMNLGTAIQAQGRYTEAVPHYERALATDVKRLGVRHLDVATAQCNLALILRRAGRYDESQALYEQSLETREALEGPGHNSVAGSLEGLASLFTDRGRFEAARPLLERALRIREQTLDPGHWMVGTSLLVLGDLQQRMGQFDEARASLERAVTILEKALGAGHPKLAQGLNNLALLYLIMGRYEAARPLLERALAIEEQALGVKHPAVAMTLINLGHRLARLGREEDALPFLERALSIHEKALGPKHPQVAVTLLNLASLLMDLEQRDEAQALFERALAIQEEALGREHTHTATTLVNLAALHRKAGRSAIAQTLLEEALATFEKLLGPQHPRVAQALTNLAGVHRQKGEGEQAVPLLERSLAIVERNLRASFLGLDPSDRLAAGHKVRVHLDAWLALAPEVGRSGYDEVLRFKGLVARTTMAERRLLRQGGAESAKQIEEFRAAERTLATLVHAMPPRFEKEKHRAWQDAYGKAAEAVEALARRTAKELAPLHEDLARLDLSRAEIQTALAADAVLLDFLRTGERYLAWIVRPRGPVERIDLGPVGTIEAACAGLADASGDVWLESGRVLRECVLAPIEARLGEDVHTLVLCPDAALAAVPFAALPGEKEGRFLIDDYLLVQVSMAQDLVPRKDGDAAGRGALVVGDVQYGDASAGHSFSPLPETRREVAFVKARLGETCAVLTGTACTEDRIRLGVEGKRLVHLATHGFVQENAMRGLRKRREDTDLWFGAHRERQLAAGHDPMLLSGLALAGVNARDDGQGGDGILTAAEASHLALDGVDLVVLSACRTALGRAESGEGVIGLVRGLQMAGARRVMASLWPVDDEATRLFMQHFYDALLREADQQTPAEALREAARRVRDTTTAAGRRFADPRHWAAFVLYER